MRISALKIIKGAMSECQSLPSGSDPSGEEAADVLQQLNEMLDDLSTRRLFMPSLPTVVINWPAGVRVLTVGPGQQIDLPKLPVKFWDADFKWNTGSGTMEQTWPMQVIDQQQYNDIFLKKWRFQWPSFLYYEFDTAFDNTATLSIWPVPSVDSPVYARYQRQLLEFAKCSSELDLPAGWTTYFRYELARRMWRAWTGNDPPPGLRADCAKYAKQIGVIDEQKSHVVSGLSAVAPNNQNRRNGGWPNILFGAWGRYPR